MTVDQRILRRKQGKDSELGWRMESRHQLFAVARRSPVTLAAADAETLPSCTECKESREGQGKTARAKAGRQSAEASPAHLTR